MIENLRALFHARELLEAWTGRIIRARYQQSILGGLWAIIQPGAAAIIFSVVFTQAIKVDTSGMPYLLFSYVALVPWTLFAASLSDMVNSQTENMNLVTKIYFPREILPLASLMARLLDFAIALCVFVVLAIFYQHLVISLMWLYLPVILVIQVLFVLGLGLMGAALNVFYRDVRHIVALGLQIWMYVSPVIYPSNLVPANLRVWYFLNPMAGILESYRAVLLYDKSPDGTLAFAGVIAVGVFVFGYWLFKRVEFQFADVV